MSPGKSISPQHGLDAFTCPHCGICSVQIWSNEGEFSRSDDNKIMPSDYLIQISKCQYCTDQCLWVDEAIVSPDIQVSLPNKDLDDDIKKDYREAAFILRKSPRAAAALLRLAMQKLCKQLGAEGKSIHNDIIALSQKGLPEGVLEAMDSVRIIGNEAVHPGEIDLRDDVETATEMFSLVNLVAEKMLTYPKKVKALHGSLPEKKRIKNNSEQSSS